LEQNAGTRIAELQVDRATSEEAKIAARAGVAVEGRGWAGGSARWWGPKDVLATALC
jgi:hypothetical protein